MPPIAVSHFYLFLQSTLQNGCSLNYMNIKEKKVIFQKEYHLLYKYVYRYVKWRIQNEDDVEDIVSHTFLCAYEKLSQWNPQKGNMKQWITGIVKNTLLQHWKKNQLHIPLEEISDTVLFSMKTLLTEIDNQKIDDALFLDALMEKLPAEMQRIIILRYVDDYTYKEIARVLGKKAAAVRKTFSRLHTEIETTLSLLLKNK